MVYGMASPVAGTFYSLLFTCKMRVFEVEARGFEPLTSAVQKAAGWFGRDFWSLQNACELPYYELAHFPAFQEIYSGCCTSAIPFWDSR
jgi:hypothetical protein